MRNVRHIAKPVAKLATKTRSDQDLAAAARGILRSDRQFWDMNAGSITADVYDGMITLSGHVATSTGKLQAEQMVNQAGGTHATENHLVVDNDLMYLVSQALADDKQKYQERIFVSVRQGVVTLNGQRSSVAERLAAEQSAAQVPTVRGVSNLIEAQGVIVDEIEQRVMQPHMGQEVFASDMSLGRVNRLIIDPHNRRVVAVVVKGEFPARQQSASASSPWDLPTQARSVVIPISAISSLTMSMVQVNMPGVEAAHYADFLASDFHLPDPAWRPPYPYTMSDCLWVLKPSNRSPVV
jgi:osmotically-inducible protein OsmY